MKKLVVIAVLVGLVSGALGGFAALNYGQNNRQQLIEHYYAMENYVHVSPHGLRKHMDQGDDSFVLVDLRSQQEYEKEHIVGAVNIPAYRDPDTSAYDDVDRIVNMFSKLPKNKDIIVYCYSTACMSGRKVGKMLADHGIFVKHLGVGWNEWRYDWELWNHEHEWDQTTVDDYIISGPQPGKKQANEFPSVCEGELGC